MRNRIWAELTQAKHNIEFASLYSAYQRKILRIFNICILAFSSAGIMGWNFWKDLPLVACIVIALVSLLKLLQPHLIMDERQLKKLDDIQKFYSDYFIQLEKLWYDFDKDRISEEQASKSFFRIKKLETKINPTITDTIRSKPKKILKKCKHNSDEYFNQVYT